MHPFGTVHHYINSFGRICANPQQLSFDCEHYQQISGVAMGTKMGSNYANLFVGYVE